MPPLLAWRTAWLPYSARFGSASATERIAGGKASEQSGNCPIKAAIGDHGRNHRSHAGVEKPRERHCPVRQWEGTPASPPGRSRRCSLCAPSRPLREQCRKIAVVIGPPTVEPGAGVQQGLQRPTVTGAFRQPSVAMRVGVDQAGNDQPARCIYAPRRRRGHAAGWRNRRDPIVFQHQIQLAQPGRWPQAPGLL